MSKAAATASGQQWYRTLNAMQWKTLLASNLGWVFDGFETFALILTVGGGALRQLLDPSEYTQIPTCAGAIIAMTLIGWALGGMTAGILANYIGRKRTMILVESRCGAVALGRTYLLPPLSSGGALVVQPWLRFHIPLIEPDRQISRIRLSDKTSRLRFRVQRHLQLLNIYRS
jgi:hypothetical protein